MTIPRQIAVLFRMQLRAERHAAEVLTVAIPFAAVALLIVPMAIGIEASLLSRIGPGIYWALVLLFGVLVTQRASASSPEAHRDALTLLGVDPAARFTATAAVSGVLLVAFEIAAGLVTMVLYAPGMTGWPWLAAVFPLVAAGLGMLGTIAGGVADGRGPLASLLVVPIAIPILLGAAQAWEGLQVGAGILRWIAVLALVDVLLALVGVLTARPLEDSAL